MPINTDIIKPEISVVIPTCNRKVRLLSVLANLNQSSFHVKEVIIVDSSDADKPASSDFAPFEKLIIRYLESEKSVCKQRNIGITNAISDWIFICDDDIEMPYDYLDKLVGHLEKHPQTGALTGLVLEKNKDEWVSRYPVTNFFELAWKFVFQLSVWGEIKCQKKNFLQKGICDYYQSKGNHISKAGWPVITDFSGDYFVTPVYGLGASLVLKSWLLNSPYDEVLDQHGIGDNYGVAVGFPTGISVVKSAFVYHHQETVNRLKKPSQYLRRIMALDYFIRTRPELKRVKRSWLVWSLAGNLLAFILSGNRTMISPAFKAIWMICFGKKHIPGAAENI